MTKIITLTQGQETIVDDDDYDELTKHKWYSNWNQGTRSFYARRKLGSKNGKQKTIMMHRIILGAQPGQEIDHRNHHTLDNRKCNLRICTCQDNNHNAKKRIDNISGFKGVSLRKTGKWNAYIRVNGKTLHLGNFDEKVDAAKAYDEAAKKYFGEFAKTNFNY